MKLTNDEFLALLISNGWHISDGVDPCSGEDEASMKKSAREILRIIYDY